MINTRRTILILLVPTTVLIVLASLAFVLRPFQAEECPSVVYFHFGR